ncbi:hypothetical protein DFH07DRAFT_969477 [Mycena maculata]|uniref:Uncharacterized protein n=1 Tax=Mycena maculata TaxID=230809 RepID=A0AAD7HVV3_9AGAR|nr:hypothetical protein DFH07DRAFT_969477 [Mycena maculata]
MEIVSLLQAYCTVTFSTLEAQKTAFQQYHADALYPTDSSIFSAATFELGGPHIHAGASGLYDRYQPNTWSILTALGVYGPVHGGHIILWDLGLVVSFPAGSSILIPTGVLRYSFVKVRNGEHCYSLIQWASAGIDRWFENGLRMDANFAANASRVLHEQRETCHRHLHEDALETFPIDGELQEEAMIYEFLSTNPTLPLKH